MKGKATLNEAYFLIIESCELFEFLDTSPVTDI